MSTEKARPPQEPNPLGERASAAEIISALRRDLPALLRDRPVVLAYVYGSVAADCLGPFSDVDIALVFDEEAGLDAYERFSLELDIAVEIENASGIREADVRTLNDAPLRVQGQVLINGLLLYSRDEDFRVAYEVSVRKRYLDFQPTLEMMREAYFARVRADLKEQHPHGEPADDRRSFS